MDKFTHCINPSISLSAKQKKETVLPEKSVSGSFTSAQEKQKLIYILFY